MANDEFEHRHHGNRSVRKDIEKKSEDNAGELIKQVKALREQVMLALEPNFKDDSAAARLFVEVNFLCKMVAESVAAGANSELKGLVSAISKLAPQLQIKFEKLK